MTTRKAPLQQLTVTPNWTYYSLEICTLLIKWKARMPFTWRCAKMKRRPTGTRFSVKTPMQCSNAMKGENKNPFAHGKSWEQLCMLVYQYLAVGFVCRDGYCLHRKNVWSQISHPSAVTGRATNKEAERLRSGLCSSNLQQVQFARTSLSLNRSVRVACFDMSHDEHQVQHKRDSFLLIWAFAPLCSVQFVTILWKIFLTILTTSYWGFSFTWYILKSVLQKEVIMDDFLNEHFSIARVTAAHDRASGQ